MIRYLKYKETCVIIVQMSSHKQFYYMGSGGLKLFRLRQLTTLHHAASSLKYDADTLYLIQTHLLQMKNPTSFDALDRVMELRRSLDPKPDVRIPPDSWEDECE